MDIVGGTHGLVVNMLAFFPLTFDDTYACREFREYNIVFSDPALFVFILWCHHWMVCSSHGIRRVLWAGKGLYSFP
jgi:hypothetical protein